MNTFPVKKSIILEVSTLQTFCEDQGAEHAERIWKYYHTGIVDESEVKINHCDDNDKDAEIYSYTSVTIYSQIFTTFSLYPISQITSNIPCFFISVLHKM